MQDHDRRCRCGFALNMVSPGRLCIFQVVLCVSLIASNERIYIYWQLLGKSLLGPIAHVACVVCLQAWSLQASSVLSCPTSTLCAFSAIPLCLAAHDLCCSCCCHGRRLLLCWLCQLMYGNLILSASCILRFKWGWFAIGCIFMMFVFWGLLFHARKACMLRSKKVGTHKMVSKLIDTFSIATTQKAAVLTRSLQRQVSWDMWQRSVQSLSSCVIALANLFASICFVMVDCLLVQLGAAYSGLAIYLIFLWYVFIELVSSAVRGLHV